MKKITFAAASLAASFRMHESAAQPAPAIAPNNYLFQHMPGGTTLERYLQVFRQDFRRLDADGTGTPAPADIDLHDQMTKASALMPIAMRMFMADLNGDGVVTED